MITPILPRSVQPWWLALLALCVLGGLAQAADAGKGPKTTIPEEKDRGRHDGFLTVAKAGGVDVLFTGDSITDGWRSEGKSIWDKYFAPLKAANFGISGDRTEHVIWRLRHGELEGIQPKLVVLMIGTNNGDPAEDVALGIKTIIHDINERSPISKILLLGIFPRGEKPAGRERNDQVNKIIATYADNRRIVYQDIGQSFLTPDGTLGKDIMPDALHPNAKGYQIWADAIIDTVKKMLQEDPSRLVPNFTKPSMIAKVAKIEEVIVSGKVGMGAKSLEKLLTDKNEKTAEAATTSMAVVTAWKDGIDAEIARLRQEGDVFVANEFASGMTTAYTGGDTAVVKTYKDMAAELKKDPTYAAGQAFQKLKAFSYVERKDPRFAKMVDGFVKKFPDGYYAKQAQALVTKE
jgi:lysophospholipase L1-like esterase